LIRFLGELDANNGKQAIDVSRTRDDCAATLADAHAGSIVDEVKISDAAPKLQVVNVIKNQVVLDPSA
jgi:hypothetical protein